jgi:hypothetical protein
MPAMRRDTLHHPIGTCMVAVLWPAAWIAVGYYFVKIRVFGRTLGRTWIRDVEIVGFLLATLLFILACTPVLRHPMF